MLQAFGLSADPFMQGLIAQTPAAGNSQGVGDLLNTTGYAFNARSNVTRDNATGKIDYYLSTHHTFLRQLSLESRDR